MPAFLPFSSTPRRHTHDMDVGWRPKRTSWQSSLVLSRFRATFGNQLQGAKEHGPWVINVSLFVTIVTVDFNLLQPAASIFYHLDGTMGSSA